MAYQAYVDDKRKFGLEIECVGESAYQTMAFFQDLEDRNYDAEIHVGSTPNINKWCITTDSTIIGKEPLELTTPILSIGEGDLYDVEVALHRLKENGFTVNESCGLHIHWDVSDYSGSQIQNLLKLYAKFEPAIDFLLAESRRGNKNNQCKSLVMDGGFEWIDYLRLPHTYPTSFEIADRFHKLIDEGKYTKARRYKLNILSIQKYQTVEFRQHQGTLDYNQLFNWIVLTQQFVNRAKTLTVESGIVSLESLFRTLGMIRFYGYNKRDEIVIGNTKDHYRKIYKENKNG